MPLKAVVVDDEQLAREELCYMLEQIGQVAVREAVGFDQDALVMVVAGQLVEPATLDELDAGATVTGHGNVRLEAMGSVGDDQA